MEAYSFKLHKTILFFSVFLCGCKTWFLSLRRPKLKGLNNRVLYSMFESKREEVSGGRRQLHSALIGFMRRPGNVGLKGEKGIAMRKN